MTKVLKLFFTATVIAAMTLASVSCDKDNGGSEPEKEASGWTSLGTGEYRDDFVTRYATISNIILDVEIEENADTAGLFRLVDPYEGYLNVALNQYAAWTNPFYDDSEHHYLVIDATDPDAVYFKIQNTGLDLDWGYLYVGSYAADRIALGTDPEEMSGTYANGLITFPASSLYAYMVDYNDDAVYTANQSGKFCVALPGYYVPTYEISLEASVEDGAAESTVTASVTIVENRGTDHVVVGIFKGSDYSEAAEQIQNGTFEGDKYTITESEDVEFTCTSSGVYTVIAVSFDAAGNAQQTVATSVSVTLGGFTDASLDALLGEYDVLKEDYYADYDFNDGAYTWTILASNDEEKGNIMFYYIDNQYCYGTVYGNYDSETNTFCIYNHQYVWNDYADWGEWGNGDYYFDIVGTDGNVDTDPDKCVTFTLEGEGYFTGPDTPFDLCYYYSDFQTWYSGTAIWTKVQGTRSKTVDQLDYVTE